MSSNETAIWAEGIWRAGLRPSPRLTVSQWAEGHRVLPATVARPGPWRTWRTPYLGGVMDALSEESRFERVVLVAGSQVGKTEAGLNWLGYVVDHAPGIALLVMPALTDTKRNVRVRIDPMIEASPTLAAKIGPARSRDGSNSLYRKVFPGGELIMTGANAASSLRSTPVRYVFLDEVDAYPLNVEDEGDVVDLAIRRTTTFKGQRKIFLCSTPKLKGASRIELAYHQSDQRRFFVPCLQCGDMAPITWARIRWPEGQRHKAHLMCEACGGVMEESDKPKILAGGEWRATAEGDGKTAGFHLPGLCSPFETWADQAKGHKEAGNDPVRLQVFVNTVLAESWEDTGGEVMETDALFSRRELYDAPCPTGAAVLTAGVDVQDDRLEVQIVGWGAGEESWVIANEVLAGDPSGRPVWEALDALLQRPIARPPGLPAAAIAAACVDTGGHNTRGAYEFCGPRHGRRVWAIKGASNASAPPWPRRPSYNNTGKVPLYLVGVNALKDALVSRLSVAEPGPGRVHFPASLPPAYFDQLTSERRITKFEAGRPKRVWVPRSHVRNEAFDTFVYAFAALCGLQAVGLNLDIEAARLVAPETLPAPRPTKKISKFMSR